MIKLLVYSSIGKERRRLLNTICDFSDRCTVETFADLNVLRCRLEKDCKTKLWLVLLMANSEELDRLVGMDELIRETKSILILPDQREGTIGAGHSLYPRYVSYLDGDFADVGSVLEKILSSPSDRASHSLACG